MSKVEVLVTTMHAADTSKYREMNLQTDAVIANQADACAFLEEEIDGKRVRFVTTATRGASVNRNIAMIYSSAEIIIFADDDQVFVDGYETIVLDAFAAHPDADAIKFFVQSTNPDRPLSYRRSASFRKANKRSLMPAGVHAFAVKRNFLTENNVFFDVRMGPGCEIYCGEDSVFIDQLFKRGATVYQSPELLSYVKQEDSTWFSGYTEQYFNSCGYTYGRIYGILSPLACVRRAVRLKRHSHCEWKICRMLRLMLRGARAGRKDK